MLNAVGMLELNSIAKGIYTADQMVKVSEVDIAEAGSVCPGKYIVIVFGDTASVETSVRCGETMAGEYLVDSIVIPNVHESVFPAIVSATMPEKIKALGIIESFSMSTMLEAADAVLKAAELEPVELRLGTGLGGKSYFTFTGDVAAVETGAAHGMEILGKKGVMINSEIIPSPSEKLIKNLY